MVGNEGRTKRAQVLQRSGRALTGNRYGRPFWLPATGYYILSMAIAIAVFFLIWGILREGGEETPWIFAGFILVVILAGAVFLREVFLKNVRQRYLLVERRLDDNLKQITKFSKVNHDRARLSLKRNAALIRGIKEKSEAARVLGDLPDGHWEVFEMCNDYLALNEQQMESVGVGSPRLPALRRGKEIVEDLHKFHLLNWVRIESRLYTQESYNQLRTGDKIDLIRSALAVIESALQFYPDERDLLESKDALREFASSIEISNWIEQAESEKAQANYQRAISLLREALFYLARENVQSKAKDLIAGRINSEIDLIRQMQQTEAVKDPKSGSALKV